MTTLSSVSLASALLGASSPIERVSRLSATAPAMQDASTPQPSSIVTIGQVGSASPSPAYYVVPIAAPVVTWETNTIDGITKLMAGNYQSQSLAGQFNGLGSALLTQLANGGGDYSQSVQVGSGSSLGGFEQALSGNQANIKLTIETKSGVEVDVTLENQGGELSVTMQSHGSLSTAERGAIGKLSSAFQSAINGLDAVPPALDLSGLSQYDPSLISSVDLSSQMTGNDQSAQSIDFHADSLARTVSVGGAAGSIKMDVDMSNPAIWGSPQRQAQAINGYLQQFDQANTQGQGNASLMALFKEAFTQMNSNDVAASGQSSAANSVSPLQQTEQAMLTGLPDFNASITDTPKASNPMRLNEMDTFSYQVSQQTQVAGGTRDGSITQHQHSELNASHHQALSSDAPLDLTLKTNSQNYDYVRVQDEADSTTNIAYQNGQLTNASLIRSADKSTHQQTYVLGKLVQDKTTPSEQSQSRDFLALLKPFLTDRNPQPDAIQFQNTLSEIHGQIFLQADPASLSN
jgi:hypothetical protein